MQREIIRVEPIDSNFEKWGAPVSTCTRAGNMVFVSGMPPFDPETGEILVHAPFERQVELILEQVKKALEAAGSDLDRGSRENRGQSHLPRHIHRRQDSGAVQLPRVALGLLLKFGHPATRRWGPHPNRSRGSY